VNWSAKLENFGCGNILAVVLSLCPNYGFNLFIFCFYDVKMVSPVLVCIVQGG